MLMEQLVREKIEDVNIDDFEILDYVKEGYSYVPTNKICSLQNDNLTEITRKYFAQFKEECNWVTLQRLNI